MANALFVSYRNNILGTGTHVDLDADTIRAMFVDHTDDTPVIATDNALDDIVAGGRIPAIASCPALAAKTIGTLAAGVFDSDNLVFPLLVGDQAESLILVKDTGVEATSLLIAYYDTGTGLPVTPSGGDVNVTVHASGWFQV